MEKLSILAIKKLLDEKKLDENQLHHLRSDKRKGVKRLLQLYDKKVENERDLKALFKKKHQFDEQNSRTCETLIAGVDEAGRGSLAGPVVAAAVMLPDDFYLPGLTDSKKVPRSVRETYFTYITKQALSYHIAVVPPTIIDEKNILEATKMAMTEALEGLTPAPHLGLIDAVRLKGVNFRTVSIIKGDDQSLAIAAASILAKVARDNMMGDIHHRFPMYDFSQNKGYGTKKHMEALMQFGPCELHRKSFTPVKQATGNG